MRILQKTCNVFHHTYPWIPRGTYLVKSAGQNYFVPLWMLATRCSPFAVLVTVCEFFIPGPADSLFVLKETTFFSYLQNDTLGTSKTAVVSRKWNGVHMYFSLIIKAWKQDDKPFFLLPKPEGRGLAVPLKACTCGPGSVETSYTYGGNLKTRRCASSSSQARTSSSSSAKRPWLADDNPRVWLRPGQNLTF